MDLGAKLRHKFTLYVGLQNVIRQKSISVVAVDPLRDSLRHVAFLSAEA